MVWTFIKRLWNYLMRLLFLSVPDSSNLKSDVSHQQQQDEYCIFRKLAPKYDSNGVPGELLRSYHISKRDAFKYVQTALEEAIKNPEKAKYCARLIKNQEILIQSYSRTICRNEILELHLQPIYDFTYNSNLINKKIGLANLIVEMFNEKIFTWQNIEDHLRTLMEFRYASKDSLLMTKIIFDSCGAELQKIMPAAYFNALYFLYKNYCIMMTECNTSLSLKEANENLFEQNQGSKTDVLEKSKKSQTIAHAQKENQFTLSEIVNLKSDESQEQQQQDKSQQQDEYCDLGKSVPYTAGIVDHEELIRSYHDSKTDAVKYEFIPTDIEDIINERIALNQTIAHAQKENQFTYSDFERIVIQPNPNYENIIKHLNIVALNADLESHVNLIISEVLKQLNNKMNKTFVDILNEMRLVMIEKNVVELKISTLLLNVIKNYSTISIRNLKSERPQVQLRAQILGNFIDELLKIDIIQCSIIESFFEVLLAKKQLKEGSLDLVYNILTSCDSELKNTLGTNKLNNYISQLKLNINPQNMTSSICTKVNSMEQLDYEINTDSVKQATVSSLKAAKNKKSNDVVKQPSTSQSKPPIEISKLELLRNLKELQQSNDSNDCAISKDLLNAYSENNQTPSNNVKQSLNYTNAIDKLSMENFEDIKGQLKDFQINTSKEVNIFVDSIFHRILMNPEIDVIGAELCKELYVKSTISIQSLICEKVVNLVEVHSNTVKNYLKFLRSHQNDLMTDTRICGFTKFIAEFFKVDLLPVAYVHMHLQRLLDLNYICEPLAYLASVLLLSCGAELYNSKLKRGVLKSFVGYLETFCQKTKTDTVVRRNFLKISKLQQNNWQVVEKASTTISHGTIKAQTKVPRCSKVKSTKNKTDYEIKIQSIMINLLSDPSSISKFVKDVANMNDHLFKNLLISECKKKLEKYEETMKLYKGQKLLELISKIQTEVDSHKRKELKGILDCLLDAPKDTARIVQFITEVVISGLRDLI